MTVRALLCGDRNWTCRRCVEDWLDAHPEVDVVIEGEARGADTIARQIAQERKLGVLAFPAQWNKYGDAAGPIRNTQMLHEGCPDLAAAFHNDIQNSKGTKNMVKQLTKAAVPVDMIVCPHMR